MGSKNNSDPLFVDPALLQQAEQLCKQRLEKDPENRTAVRSLAEVYRKLGWLAQAAAAYDRLFQLDPTDRDAGYMQAVFGGKEWSTTPTGVRAAPFVVLKDFLPRDFHDTLLPYFISLREKFVPVLGGTKEYQPNARQTLGLPGEWEGRKRFRDKLVEALSRVVPRLHLPPFKISSYDIQVRAYQDGHFFKVHRDGPVNTPYADRVINFVYYFHKVPRSYTGGELLLFDSDLEGDAFTKSRFTCVVPEDNSVIMFPANFYHSVVPIRCPSMDFADSRFTINGHVHKRMEAEPAVEASVESHGRVAVS